MIPSECGKSPDMKRPVVAMDGPAGAGKSTVARRVADALGFVLVDTGALYRTVALAAERAGISWDDHPRVAALATELVASRAVRLGSAGGKTRVTLRSDDVSDAIRTPEISRGASTVSAIPDVRTALLDMQRSFLREGGAVMEGRDIGTVVAPDAELKFFVTASAEVRALRRHEELLAKGQPSDYEATLREVVARDHADSTRAVAPLVPAKDAEIVDTSKLSIDDVVAHLVARVRERFPELRPV